MEHLGTGRTRWSTHRFSAMGSLCSVQIYGRRTRVLHCSARERIAELEKLWSRFLPSSEVSTINANPETATKVSGQTIELTSFALDAWKHTSGIFCPFIGVLMNTQGYDATFAAVSQRSYQSDLKTRTIGLTANSQTAKPGALVRNSSPVLVDELAGTIAIEGGYALDFGGVAKGFAADLVADQMIEAGALAVMVDLGGDVSCRTAEPNATVWQVESEMEGEPGQAPIVVASIELRNGGVATSSTRRRHWVSQDGSARHHLMNPASEQSASSGVVMCSIAADRCAHAEVLTKLAICGGVRACRDIADRFVPDVLAVTDEGSVVEYGSWVRR